MHSLTLSGFRDFREIREFKEFPHYNIIYNNDISYYYSYIVNEGGGGGNSTDLYFDGDDTSGDFIRITDSRPENCDKLTSCKSVPGWGLDAAPLTGANILDNRFHY